MNDEPEHGTSDEGTRAAEVDREHGAERGHEVGRRLHRPSRNRMLGGVAAGAAAYLDADPTLVRIGFVVLTLMGGVAVPLYLAGWLLIPDEDGDVSLAEELVARERVHA
jgi:phage shock protein PspC (stress-responsive transcriptional regulator)